MTTITNTDPNAAAAAKSAAGTGAVSKLNADFDMFLKLLTTQMQNQDPLDPMDTAQYTQQLVQYSQVEQSIEQTSTLKSILAGLGNQNLVQASALIGAQVETGSATAGVSATAPAQWIWSTSRDVESLTATIKDAKGRIVDTRAIEGGKAAGSFEWDGTTSGGTKLDPGLYTLELQGVDGAGNKLGGTAHAFGKVSDVELADGVVQVTVNGLKIPSSGLVRVGQ